jgi:hypothetical protein
MREIALGMERALHPERTLVLPVAELRAQRRAH